MPLMSLLVLLRLSGLTATVGAVDGGASFEFKCATLAMLFVGGWLRREFYCEKKLATNWFPIGVVGIDALAPEIEPPVTEPKFLNVLKSNVFAVPIIREPRR